MAFYTYIDNSKGEWEITPGAHAQWVTPTIFQCEAESILEADKLFEEAVGKDPSKMKHVGCCVKQEQSA